MHFNFEDNLQIKALGAWFLATLITTSIYIGGIGDQLRFGSEVCLLFIENYHKEPNSKQFSFNAFSPSCDASVTMGTLGLFLLFGVFAVRLFFHFKSQEPSRTVYLALSAVGTVWAFISLVMAIVFSKGLAQTCTEFEKSSKSCGAVFGEGFFENTTDVIYKKNINTINAALGSSWTLVVFWVAYAAFEYYSYRNASLKWW